MMYSLKRLLAGSVALALIAVSASACVDAPAARAAASPLALAMDHVAEGTATQAEQDLADGVLEGLRRAYAGDGTPSIIEANRPAAERWAARIAGRTAAGTAVDTASSGALIDATASDAAIVGRSAVGVLAEAEMGVDLFGAIAAGGPVLIGAGAVVAIGVGTYFGVKHFFFAKAGPEYGGGDGYKWYNIQEGQYIGDGFAGGTRSKGGHYLQFTGPSCPGLNCMVQGGWHPQPFPDAGVRQYLDLGCCADMYAMRLGADALRDATPPVDDLPLGTPAVTVDAPAHTPTDPHHAAGVVANALADSKNDALARRLNELAPVRTVPSCDDMDYSDCVAALENEGFVAHRRVVVDDVDVDLDLPAGAVLRTAPAEESAVSVLDEIQVFTNPDSMPDWARGNQERRHDCDTSTPLLSGVGDPSGQVHGEFEPFAGDDALAVLATPPAPVFYAPDEPDDELVLRWGYTSPPPATKDNDLWNGWGYRHVAAKHGWSQTDAETVALIVSTQHPVKQTNDRYIYTDVFQYAGRNGALCARVVVVERRPGYVGEKDQYKYGETVPALAPGIWTTFGKRLN